MKKFFSIYNKLGWRVRFIYKSMIPMIQAFLEEKEKQPWQYIFDYWFLPAKKRYKKSLYYLENNLLPGITMDKNEIIINNYRVDISSALSVEGFFLGVIAEYFDFIYPKKVKHPIPFFISEGPYERGGCVIERGDVVIDAGANLGFFSWLIANKVGTSGHIYLFEPIESLSTIIKSSIQENKTFTYMEVIEAATSDEDGVLYFDVQDFAGGSHVAAEGKKVQAITIDTFVKKRNIPKITFLKADIEGMEPRLLNGARHTIIRDKPKIAICTYHDKKHRKLLTDMLSEMRPDYQFDYSSHKLFAW